MSVNILIVNNYRDIEEDKLSDKRTLIVRFGRQFGIIAYYFNIIVASSIAFRFLPETSWLVGICLLSYFFTTAYSIKQTEGTGLNKVLATTARNVLIYSVWLILTIATR